MHTTILCIVINMYPGSHGDMLYLDAVMSPPSQVSMATQQVKQDEVDNILQEKDGKIYREINAQL